MIAVGQPVRTNQRVIRQIAVDLSTQNSRSLAMDDPDLVVARPKSGMNEGVQFGQGLVYRHAMKIDFLCWGARSGPSFS